MVEENQKTLNLSMEMYAKNLKEWNNVEAQLKTKVRAESKWERNLNTSSFVDEKTANSE